MDFLEQQSNPSNEPGAQNQVTQTHVNVRCPGCLKLYSVSTVEIHEERPQFECNGCSENFYLMYPECLGIEEVVGFPVKLESPSFKIDAGSYLSGPTAVEIETEKGLEKSPQIQEEEKPSIVSESILSSAPVFHCPKCSAPRRGGDSECVKCGVVFDKLKFIEDGARPAHSSHQKLNSAWGDVMDQYEEDQVHSGFVEICRTENQLDFAAYKYRRILNAHAGDERAQKMIDQIEKLALASSGMAHKVKKRKRTQGFRWTTLLAVLGIALMGMGYGVEQLRNLIGLGVALTFFSLALRFYFR